MPTLSTFGGASVRSYGRNIQQTPAVVPKNAVLFLQSSSATVPTGWTYYANCVGMFVRGASSNTEIGTTNAASGNVSMTWATIGQGTHGTSTAGVQMFVEYSMSTIYSYTFKQAQLSEGNHVHSYSLPAPIDAASAPPPHYKFPVVTCNNIKNVLPPYTIVFRKTAPSSLNFVKPTYYTDTVADKAHFRGHNSSYSFDSGIYTSTGNSTAGGQHSHRGSTSRPPAGGSATSWGFEQFAGSHVSRSQLSMA
jgi:hypothetical protein